MASGELDSDQPLAAAIERDAAVGRTATVGLISQSATLVVGAAGAAVFAMAYSSLCARLLTPTRFADITAALSISVFLTIPTWPLDVATTMHAAHAFGSDNRALLRAGMSRALRRAIKGAALCTVLWLALAPFARSWLDLDSFALLAMVGLNVVGAFLLCVPRGVLRGDHRFGSFAANQVLEAAVRAGAGALLLFAGFGTAGAMGGYVAGAFVAYAYGLFQLRDLPRDPSLSVRDAEVSTFGPVLAFHLYILFGAHIDMLVAKHVLSAQDAGLYGAATTLSRALYLVAIPVYQVLLARVAALHAAGKPTRPIVARGLLLLCALLVASCIVPFVVGRLCLELLFGESFVGALGPLRALWIAVALTSLQAAIVYVLIGTGKARGFWTLICPSVILCGLLATYHGSAQQVAFCTLMGAAIGVLWCCGLAWIGRGGATIAVDSGAR